ncbi:MULTISPECIES: tyrosine-type recombinase/integrase [Bacillales]|uniref:tyrosine-type recombinase/integrase n=1 Tax=Bacillales TaxID=1385 RepID=UPI0006A7838E|nr:MULTISPECIES: tyrosine-type recombinase/integrase [Bacillales]OBZ12885.1 recombinase XerC [Bacillus sp. FJAT-26390]OBZ15217.1 recombinase XerC [Bacillus sp. FJAT-26390]
MIVGSFSEERLALQVVKEKEITFTDEQKIQMFLSNRSRSQHTYKSYYRAIERFRMFISYKNMNDVTWREIEAFKVYLLSLKNEKTGLPLAPASVSATIAALKSFYKWGSDPNIGLFQQNPTSSVRLPVIPLMSKKHFLTKNEVGKLLQFLQYDNKRNYLIALSLLLLGLRVSELCSIRWCDFYSDATESNVWLTVTRGKGGKIRDIKVPRHLWLLFSSYLGTKPHLSSSSDSQVFSITSRQVERMIKAACLKCGLDKPVTPHWLRHTNATLALLNGASLQQVQETLGHSHINTTQRYLHTVEQLTKSASDYVEELLIAYI